MKGVKPKTIFCLLTLVALSATFAAEQNIYRVLPLGDSIMEGGNNFSNYRYPLLQKLSAAGYRAEFTGSRTSASPAGPLRHEGYNHDAQAQTVMLAACHRINP